MTRSQTPPLFVLSDQEEAWAAALPVQRGDDYRWSRRWLRSWLGELFKVQPAFVPLWAPPGQPPRLDEGWGFISLSHCPDALLVGWAPWRIGVDLERSDRQIPASALLRRFFCSAEQQALQRLEAEPLRRAVLQSWLRKEAAIKWQWGSLAQDLGDWCCDLDHQMVIHQRNGLAVWSLCWNVGEWSLAMALGHRDVPDDGEVLQAVRLCLA